ncbi:hypothetical protein [Sphingomonas sp.]|uniref:hypothetical protein n=1 Tax=Sphingomonas sp. TaxID=28214 RepID=UPI0028A95815|nr:hypothetical protein [Sphingomonas sp.]
MNYATRLFLGHLVEALIRPGALNEASVRELIYNLEESAVDLADNHHPVDAAELNNLVADVKACEASARA